MAVIRYTSLKQSIIIVQGVLVCLYVIQFTRYSCRSFARSRGLLNILYFITAFFVCQELFSSFLNFFEVLFKRFSCVPILRRPDYLSTSFEVCQALFSSSFNFLSDSLWYSAALADSLHIIAPQNRFVNTFFHYFSIFLLKAKSILRLGQYLYFCLFI